MSSLTHKTERVLNLLRELPPAKVNEVIDFAEYLKAKSLKTKSHKQSATELPLYHSGAIEPDVFEGSTPSDVAQEHDRWVHSQIDVALKEANDPATVFIPHDTVQSRWAEKKNALHVRAAKVAPS